MKGPILSLSLLALALPTLFITGCGESTGPVDQSERVGNSGSDRFDREAVQDQEIRSLLDGYLEAYLTTFPSRATAAGDHRQDRRLEDYSPGNLNTWVAENQLIKDRLERFLQEWSDDSHSWNPEVQERRDAVRLDAEIILRWASREIFRFHTLDQSRQDPLFWSSVLGSSAVFLLVRDDLPLADRLDRLADRTALIPRFCGQAQTSLSLGSPERLVSDHAQMAAAQIRAAADFFANRLVESAEPLQGEETQGETTHTLRRRLSTQGRQAAEAMTELADFIDELAVNGTGDPRLGPLYARNFYLGTGIEEPVDALEKKAESDLQATALATANYCRAIWSQIATQPSDPEPDEDDEVIRACFRRIARDRIESVDAFVDYYRKATREAFDFVNDHKILTQPGTLTLSVDRSPAFLAGQAVGGIYPSGPFSPHAHALLFVPTIADSAPPEMKNAFYGDFNLHFNLMITPHETTPGHYAQGKAAALGSSKIRAIFYDGVYVEGWGTFSEKLMLDHGWGGPLTRVAHLKKQLENIARTLVDIRVHNGTMDRQQMLQFLREQAFQDGQFAINMWTRATTSSPQLTTYYLGFKDISEFYQGWRARHPQAPTHEFSDRMMSLGPVPVRNYRPLLKTGS